NVGRVVEDMAMDEALNAYARANGIRRFRAGGEDYYVLGNPGRPVTFDVDFDDGKGYRTVTFSAVELRYPRARRQYAAVELVVERIYDGKWRLQGSYTHAYSWGNDEGLVSSDYGDSGPGTTTLFDHPGLMEHSTGYLPNDLRHR